MALSDWFKPYMRSRTDGAYSCELIDMTGGDVTLSGPSRGLEVDADGVIEVEFVDQPGVAVERPIKAGEIRPFNVSKIIAAGTDADEVAVYR
mgnify:CR=1 FL=1